MTSLSKIKDPERRRRERRIQLQKVQALIRDVKSQPCVDCEKEFPYYVMDFDHCRGVKLFGINASGTRSLTAMREEIAKCEVVCANCHRIREAKKMGIAP